MAEKLAILIEKVEKLLEMLDSFKKENLELKNNNSMLLKELTKVKKDNNSLKITAADKNDKVKTKLTGIVNRLEKLEELAS